MHPETKQLLATLELLTKLSENRKKERTFTLIEVRKREKQRHTILLSLLDWGVVQKFNPMDSLTFLQNINSNINSAILSVLNLVLFLELTATYFWGMS